MRIFAHILVLLLVWGFELMARMVGARPQWLVAADTVAADAPTFNIGRPERPVKPKKRPRSPEGCSYCGSAIEGTRCRSCGAPKLAGHRPHGGQRRKMRGSGVFK